MPFDPQATEILDQLLSASPDLVFVQDLIGRCTYANAASARVFGIEPNQFLGKLLQDLDLPLPVVELLNHQREIVFANGRSVSGEINIPTPYQTQRQYEYIYSPIQDAGNKIVHVVFTARDITERKQAEIALRESEEKYRSLFDAASDSILIADFATGRLLNVNWSAARQLGYSRRELLERCMSDVEVVAENGLRNGHGRREILRKLEIQGNAVFESVFRRKNGTQFSVEIHAQVIEYENHLVVQHFVRDITDRKQTEAEIRALNSDLEQRVLQRTTELSLMNQELAAEIAERQRTEAALLIQQQQERLVSSIAQQVHQSLDLAEVLNTSVTEVRQFLQTDRVFIYRFGANWHGHVIVESVAAEQQSMLGHELSCPGFDEKEIKIYQQGQISKIEDIYDANLPTSFIEFLSSVQVRANLIVPILQGKQLWGLLIAHHCKEPRQWQVLEVELLKQLAVQIGIAIQQAELYQNVQVELQERKQIEMALRQSEAMNRILVDANPNLVIRMQRDGTYLNFLPAKDFKVIKPHADMRGTNIADIMPADIVQQRMHYVNLALNTGETQTYEFQLTIEGQTCYQEAQVAVSGTDEVVVIIRDISDRKQREINLQQSEQQFRQLVENSQAVFFICSPDLNRLFYVSPAYERLWQCSCESLYQNPISWLDRVHPDDRAAVLCTTQQQIQGKTAQVRYRLICPDDSIRWILAHTTLVPNSSDGTYRIVGLAEDITHLL